MLEDELAVHPLPMTAISSNEIFHNDDFQMTIGLDNRTGQTLHRPGISIGLLDASSGLSVDHRNRQKLISK